MSVPQPKDCLLLVFYQAAVQLPKGSQHAWTPLSLPSHSLLFLYHYHQAGEQVGIVQVSPDWLV